MFCAILRNEPFRRDKKQINKKIKKRHSQQTKKRINDLQSSRQVRFITLFTRSITTRYGEIVFLAKMSFPSIGCSFSVTRTSPYLEVKLDFKGGSGGLTTDKS